MSETETATGRARTARGRVLLVMCEGAATVHELPVSGPVIIGRGSDADVVIDHRTLSRAHAKLALGAHVTISDCGSRNGTIVAGRRLEPGQTVLVAPGSPIELGEALVVVRAGNERGPDLLASTGSADGGASIERTIRRIAKSQVAVLLVGEPGTGKEALAALLHASSPRARGPLVMLAARAETSREAVERSVTHAREGTLVVREPSLLSATVQVALREALTRDGAALRTVAITSRDLFKAAGSGALDRGLFDRLAGVSLVVPPLRARLAELGAIADAILVALAAEHGRPRALLSSDAMAALGKHTWPGNLRELRNVLSTAVLLGKGRVLTASHLDVGGVAVAAGASGGSLSAVVDEAEHRRILEALRHCQGNQTRAAKMLGVSRGTLISRLDRFAVPRPRK